MINNESSFPIQHVLVERSGWVFQNCKSLQLSKFLPVLQNWWISSKLFGQRFFQRYNGKRLQLKLFDAWWSWYVEFFFHKGKLFVKYVLVYIMQFILLVTCTNGLIWLNSKTISLEFIVLNKSYHKMFDVCSIFVIICKMIELNNITFNLVCLGSKFTVLF